MTTLPGLGRTICVAAALSGAATHACAGSLSSSGDGSGTDNPALLDPGFSCANCLSSPPSLPDDLPFDIDWGLTLRGAYVAGSLGNRYETSATPMVTLVHTGLRSSLSLSAGAEIARSSIEPWRLAAMRVGIAAGYRLDTITAIAASANLSLSRASVSDPGNDAGTILAPAILAGDASVSVTRDIGWFEVTPRALVSRTLYGPTTLAGPLVVDNTWQSNVASGAGVRVAARVTPVLGVFADGEVRHQIHDAPSPTLLVPLNHTEYTIKAGVFADVGDLFEGEASVGYGLVRYTSGLPAFSGLLYDASLTYRPDETVTLAASFGTALSPPGSGGGTGRIAYTAGADARYEVNPWLAVRASLDWSQTTLVGTGTTERGYGAGVGLDYSVTDQTTVTADYSYSYALVPPGAPTSDHRVTLGLSVSDEPAR